MTTVNRANRFDNTNYLTIIFNDRHNLSGALDTMADKMTDSQRSRYNTAIANMVHYYTASEDMTEFNNLYRKLRYGI